MKIPIAMPRVPLISMPLTPSGHDYDRQIKRSLDQFELIFSVHPLTPSVKDQVNLRHYSSVFSCRDMIITPVERCLRISGWSGLTVDKTFCTPNSCLRLGIRKT